MLGVCLLLAVVRGVGADSWYEVVGVKLGVGVGDEDGVGLAL